MKTRLCLVSLFLGMVASTSAYAAPPAADFKAMMRKTLDAWETLDPANAAAFYDPNPDNVYLKGFEVLPDVSPFKGKAGAIQTLIEFFSEDQCQEAAKHMASNGSIALMVNRTCFEQ